LLLGQVFVVLPFGDEFSVRALTKARKAGLENESLVASKSFTSAVADSFFDGRVSRALHRPW
jgi:hypothetical protein